jgi:hypothetical protein
MYLEPPYCRRWVLLWWPWWSYAQSNCKINVSRIVKTEEEKVPGGARDAGAS